MKIALYGMPCAGKSTLMDRITDAKVINGSQELRRICGGSFLELSEEEKHQVRIKYTEYINGLNDEVIVSDGHYSFMETVAFTEADGDLYDIFIYLYCSPENLKERYALSEKNGKFAGESIESLRQWQEFEINNLREECHRRNKDFYVVSDNEEEQNKFFDFLSLLREGFSSYDLATDICNQIMEQFNKQDIFTLAGPEYARSKGETTPLLRPWYNRKSINLQHDVPLDDRIFSPELAQDVISGFQSLMPFYRYFDRLCVSTAEA